MDFNKQQLSGENEKKQYGIGLSHVGSNPVTGWQLLRLHNGLTAIPLVSKSCETRISFWIVFSYLEDFVYGYLLLNASLLFKVNFRWNLIAKKVSGPGRTFAGFRALLVFFCNKKSLRKSQTFDPKNTLMTEAPCFQTSERECAISPRWLRTERTGAHTSIPI